MSQTNWDLELKRIEKEFEKENPNPVIKLENARPVAAKRQPMARSAGPSPLAVWSRLVLVLTVPVALYFWPYAHGCGLGLYGYLAAMVVILAGGLWTAVSSWQARIAPAHVAAMLVVIASLALLATQVLPRVGYAKVDAAQPPGWACAAN